MIVSKPRRLPDDKHQVEHRAVRLEWLTLFFLITIIVVMYLAMGNSQAMRTAWIEDMLSLVPPILFLIAVRVKKYKPNPRHPYGYRRVSTAAFLGAALALLAMGLYMFIESAWGLWKLEHPSIGLMNLWGWQVWAGWIMIAALIYSIIPPVVLGHLKKKPAEQLHEKTLAADAAMNKADWMTAVAGVLGILGIGYGFWWADGVAACFIALDILWDGFRHTGRSIHDLMEQRPTETDRETAMTIDRDIIEAVQKLDWVKKAHIRLRNDGEMVAGELYLLMHHHDNLYDQLAEAHRVARDTDWRVSDLAVVPVDDLARQSIAEPTSQDK